MKRVAISVVLIVCAATVVAQQPPVQPMDQQQPAPRQPGEPQIVVPRELKNVQLLKGMTPGQLIRTMQFISASLGVSCDFCHVVQPDGDRDFPSDDKKEKKTAREMIQLVMDTNSKFFENRTEVTCETCHRGTNKPLSVPVLPIAQPKQRPGPPQLASADQRPAMPSRDEIVSKYTSALGKADASTLSSMELKGVRETPRGNAPFDVIVAPGKVRVSSTMPDGEMVSVVNGNSGWVHDPRGTRAMQPQQVDTAMQVADAYRITLPDEIPAKARVGKEKDKIGDRDVWFVSMPFGTDGRQRLFFDAQTGLLVRRIRYTPTPIGNIPQQTDFDDYRDVNGVKLPFVVRIDTIDPRAGATRRYSDINLKPKIDESMFAQPQ